MRALDEEMEIDILIIEYNYLCDECADAHKNTTSCAEDVAIACEYAFEIRKVIDKLTALGVPKEKYIRKI